MPPVPLPVQDEEEAGSGSGSGEQESGEQQAASEEEEEEAPAPPSPPKGRQTRNAAVQRSPAAAPRSKAAGVKGRKQGSSQSKRKGKGESRRVPSPVLSQEEEDEGEEGEGGTPLEEPSGTQPAGDIAAAGKGQMGACEPATAAAAQLAAPLCKSKSGGSKSTANASQRVRQMAEEAGIPLPALPLPPPPPALARALSPAGISAPSTDPFALTLASPPHSKGAALSPALALLSHPGLGPEAPLVGPTPLSRRKPPAPKDPHQKV